MVNLVTVTGHHTHTLPHMLNHYKDLVDDIFIIVYQHHKDDEVLEQTQQICKDFNIDIHETVIEEPFNWNAVTYLYNKTKRLRPNDWWIVSDDDEFHLYPKPINELLDEADDRGFEFITGGFLDRIGPGGTFPVITSECNIWDEMPLAGFFRNPLSGAEANKCCVTKGHVTVTPGQHYARINGQNLYREAGWGHPKRFPIEECFIQVNHFKWDHTILDRLKQVSEKITEYSYWQEYKRMYDSILINGERINISDPRFHIVESGNDYYDYPYWDILREEIKNIRF